MNGALSLNLHSIAENIEDDSMGESSTHTMAPVSRLHDKMLQFIFFLASADNLFCRNDSIDSRADTARHSAQVCQRWRILAIQTPHIWLGPVLWKSWTSCPDWLRIVLQRTSPLPLEEVVIPPGISQERYSRVMIEISKVTRFRSLQIAITHAFSAESTPADPNEPAFLTEGRLPLSLVDNTHGGRPIRRLPVSSRYNPISRIYRSVREIALSQNSSLGPVLELLRALRGMESLEILQITRPFDDSTADMSLDLPTFPANRAVLFPELRRLTITAPISTCACVVKNIRTPPTCAVKLDCHLTDVGPYLNEVLRYMRWVMSFWGCEPTGGRQFLQMDATHIEYMLEGPLDEFESLEEIPTCHPDVSLALYWKRSQSPEEPPNQKLVNLFSLTMSAFQVCSERPNTLDIEIDNDLPVTLDLQNVIFRWLESMSHTVIQDLKFRTWTSLSLFEEAIRMDDVLPLLSGLIFYNMTFGSHLKRAWNHLLAYLDQRDQEYPVYAIEFEQCDFSDFDYFLKRAQKTVGCLTIDGKEYDPSEDAMDEDSDGYGSDVTIHGR